MQHFIVYAAFAPETVNQCRYALLKYLEVYNLKPPAQTGVVLYTHRPAAFEAFTNFFPSLELINEETAADEKPRHLRIVPLLKKTLAERRANLLYCDAAAYAVKPLEDLLAEIDEQETILYAKRSGKPVTAAVEQTAVAAGQLFDDGKPGGGEEWWRWQASVVGIHRRQSSVLDEALALGRALQSKTTAAEAEDLALAYCFQRKGSVRSAEVHVRHYGGFKEFNGLLQTFFERNEEESIPNLVKAVHHLDAAAVYEQKQAYDRLPFYTKWFNAVTGKGWSLQRYAKKL